MDGEHTTGEWRVKTVSGNVYVVTDDPDARAELEKHTVTPTRWTGLKAIAVAAVRSLEDGGDNAARRRETRANAALIAAAPDMLAALEECAATLQQVTDAYTGRDMIDLDTAVFGHAAVCQAHAAMAKARGE